MPAARHSADLEPQHAENTRGLCVLELLQLRDKQSILIGRGPLASFQWRDGGPTRPRNGREISQRSAGTQLSCGQSQGASVSQAVPPIHDPPSHELLSQSHVPLQDASQVGQPGHVHCVLQVHCSPKTVPFSLRTGTVSKLSTRRSSSCSLSLCMGFFLKRGRWASRPTGDRIAGLLSAKPCTAKRKRRAARDRQFAIYGCIEQRMRRRGEACLALSASRVRPLFFDQTLSPATASAAPSRARGRRRCPGTTTRSAR
jgi:hypothetical protein